MRRRAPSTRLIAMRIYGINRLGGASPRSKPSGSTLRLARSRGSYVVQKGWRGCLTNGPPLDAFIKSFKVCAPAGMEKHDASIRGAVRRIS